MATRKDDEDLASRGIKNETGGGGRTEEEESAHGSGLTMAEWLFLRAAWRPLPAIPMGRCGCVIE